MAGQEFKQRQLDKEFFERWLNPNDLGAVSRAAYALPDTILQLRGDQEKVQIYYRGVLMLTVNRNGSFQDVVNKTSFYVDDVAKFPWTDFFLMMMSGINARGDCDAATPDKSGDTAHPNGCEKEVQQRIVMENNFMGDASTTDYFIVDTEYNMKRQEAGQYANRGRMDLIALHWPSGNAHPTGIAFIEVKAGVNAIGEKAPRVVKDDEQGEATLVDHLGDVCEFIEFLETGDNKKTFYQDMQIMFYQLYKMGWFKKRDNDRMKDFIDYWDKKFRDGIADVETPKVVRTDEWAAPQMVFAIANYKPGSKMLHNQIFGHPKSVAADNRCVKSLYTADARKKYDLRFATSDFIGYGLYDRCMLTLDEFIDRYEI